MLARRGGLFGIRILFESNAIEKQQQGFCEQPAFAHSAASNADNSAMQYQSSPQKTAKVASGAELDCRWRRRKLSDE